MTDKKLTDGEIVKALECCLSNNYEDCKDCPTKDLSTDYLECRNKLREIALDLINRLQAKAIKEQNKNSKLRNERNRLQSQNKDLSETVHNLTIEKDALFDKVEELKAEIERLKTEKDNLIRTYSECQIANLQEFMHRAENKLANNKDISMVGYQSVICDMEEAYKELVGEDK